MKKVLFVLIVTASMISCDKIKKPYTVAEAKLLCDTPSFAALNTVIQKYLLEDYTGHRCSNCPRAQIRSANLLVAMKDTLVLVAIHAGTQARPEAKTDSCSYHADYQTAAGNIYADRFKISEYPSGMINRCVYDGKQVLSDAKWQDAFNSIVRKAPSVALQIQTLTPTTADMCVFVKTTLLDTISSNLRLCVLLTEDSIVSPQLSGTGDVCNYVHNHMLRMAVSNPLGDNLTITAIGASQIKGYTIQTGGKIKDKAHCHIIAFVYNPDTEAQEIIQVEEIKLIE
jgi:hypothetical protein